MTELICDSRKKAISKEDNVTCETSCQFVSHYCNKDQCDSIWNTAEKIREGSQMELGEFGTKYFLRIQLGLVLWWLINMTLRWVTERFRLWHKFGLKLESLMLALDRNIVPSIKLTTHFPVLILIFLKSCPKKQKNKKNYTSINKINKKRAGIFITTIPKKKTPNKNCIPKCNLPPYYNILQVVNVMLTNI